MLCSDSKLRNDNRFSVFHGRFMGTYSRCRDITAKNFIDPGLSVFDNTAYKFMHKMWMRAVMSSARTLLERILGIERVKITADRETLECLGQSVVEVGHFHLSIADGSIPTELKLTVLGDIGIIQSVNPHSKDFLDP